MQLYDTMQRAIVSIIPVIPGQLRIYACGPTVYRDAHVGNMRTFLLTDLIARVASLDGLTARVVQNITDVGHMADDTGLGDVDEGQGDGDDKVLSQAMRERRSALDIASDYTARFHEDCRALNITPAEAYPKASEWIEQMLDVIGTLIERGHAYVGADGSVFFDARSYPDYGAISGNRLDQLKPGYRFEGVVDPAKRFHADWALWKAAGPTRTELTWETPWGRGYPGWHIECSAMSLGLLGPTIDVHTGGVDLRFPHHEDERAQSNCTSGDEVVRHWVHAEHLLFEGRKMSKSANNVVLVRDVQGRGIDPLALRLAFLQHHYRQQMNLTWDVITGAQTTLTRWRRRVADWASSPSQAIHEPTRAEIFAAFANDLDTAAALQALHRLERDASVDDGAKFETFAHADRLLGLDLVRDVGRGEVIPIDIQEIVNRRSAARTARDWAMSDALRDELAERGWQVTDGPDGQQVTQI
jgi:cysteinyl-tRNA synthetase